MKKLLDTLGAVATAEQREVLASPLRLEILGHLSPSEGLAVRELAERMGKSASSLYYHLHRMVDVGLVRAVTHRRPGERSETRYQVTAHSLRLEPDGSAGSREVILRAMTTGFRMAERDLEAALAGQVPEGHEADRPATSDGFATFATRLHFRARPEVLDEIRGHLLAAIETIQRELQSPRSDSADGRLFSLTLALLPLKGRNDMKESP